MVPSVGDVPYRDERPVVAHGKEGGEGGGVQAEGGHQWGTPRWEPVHPAALRGDSRGAFLARAWSTSRGRDTPSSSSFSSRPRASGTRRATASVPNTADSQRQRRSRRFSSVVAPNPSTFEFGRVTTNETKDVRFVCVLRACSA